MGSPIRTLVFASIVLITFLFAYLGFIGSYQQNNNIVLNSTLKSQYQAILGNNTQSSLFGLDGYSSQANNQGTQIGASSTSLNTIGMVAQFLSSIPSIYTSVSQLTIGTLGNIMGINLNFFQTNLILLIVIIVVIGILSAIFLFPI